MANAVLDARNISVVFGGLVVAREHRVGLLARPHVPLLGHDDGGCVGAQPGESVAENAGGQDVRTVDPAATAAVVAV